MITETIKALYRSLNSPQEVRDFPNGKLELVTLGETVVGRATLRPGWRWSKDVRPLVKTSSCQAAHLQYVVSGELGIRMDDGTEFRLSAGDAASIGPGHDAWVIGNEPCVLVDFAGMKEYAQRQELAGARRL
jgi:hypothetical protein